MPKILIILLCFTVSFAIEAKVSATDFHLSLAEQYLTAQQYAYAWGDFSYVLARDPKNHKALEQMSQIAAKINKQDEMNLYFEQAIDMYPEDQVVKNLFKNYTDILKVSNLD